MTEEQQKIYPEYITLKNEMDVIDKKMRSLREEHYTLQAQRDHLIEELNKKEALVQKTEKLLTSIGESIEVTDVSAGWTSDGNFYRNYSVIFRNAEIHRSYGELEFKKKLESGEWRKVSSEKEWVFPKSVRLQKIQFLSEKQDTAICSTLKGRLFVIRVRDSWRNVPNIITSTKEVTYYLSKKRNKNGYSITERNDERSSYLSRRRQRDTLFTCDVIATGTEKADLLAQLI